MLKKISTYISILFIISIAILWKQSSVFYPNTKKPILIAHHGGGGQWPENTLFAIKKSLQNSIQIITVTTVLSKDNIPVLFHGFKLSTTTNAKGSPENFTLKNLQKLDAGYRFTQNKKYIYRNKGIKIPTLKQAIAIIPNNTKIIVDIKTHKYKTLIDTLQSTIAPNQWKKIIFYSTEGKALQYLKQKYPHSTVFLDRETTRKILLNYKIRKTTNIHTIPKEKLNWIAYENSRTMTICEKFTLGKSCTTETFNNLWNTEIIHKIRKHNPNAKIIMIHGNTSKDYHYADKLHMYGIYTDFPTHLKHTKTP